MNKRQKGFTIVELVIVIAVIAILAAVLIPTFADMRQKAERSARLQETQNALRAYLVNIGGKGIPNGSFILYRDGMYAYRYTYSDGGLSEESETTVDKGHYCYDSIWYDLLPLGENVYLTVSHQCDDEDGNLQCDICETQLTTHACEGYEGEVNGYCTSCGESVKPRP